MRRLSILMVLIMLVWAVPVAAFADTSGSTTTPPATENTLTLDQAVAAALQHSTDAQTADLDVQAAQKSRDDSWDTYRVATISTGLGNGTYLSTGTDAQALVYGADFKLRAQEKTKDVTNDQIVYSVYKQYYTILEDIQKVNVAQLNADRDKLLLAFSQAKFNVGMESQLQLDLDRKQNSSSQASLASAQSTLVQDYESFNVLLGLQSGSRPTLTDTPSYKPLDLTDPETAIKNIAESTPTVWLANQTIDLQKNTMGMGSSYDQDRIALKKDYVDLDAQRQDMVTAVRKAYYGVKSLEDSYATTEVGAQAAEQSLHNTQLCFDQGMVTKADVLSAEAAAAQAQEGLFEIICNHELSKMGFETPWAAGGSSGGSSSSGGSASSGSSSYGSQGQ